MATHSSILAWEIPWIEEPWVYSPWGHKGLDKTDWTCMVQVPLSQGWECRSKCYLFYEFFEGGRSQGGRGIGRGDHFLPHKFIKRSFECWVTSTKQLLNAGGGHQAPGKAAQSLSKQVGQNIKDKNRDRGLGTETHPGEGVVKKFTHNRKPSHGHVSGELWDLRGQHNWKKKNP